MKEFFANSELIDHMVLRPLSHIHSNWELVWDPQIDAFVPEDDSFAALLNQLIEELGQCTPPLRYHDNEDRLAELVKSRLNWQIRKVGKRWIGEDYDVILEQGGFGDVDQDELVLAAAGRVKAARERSQMHFDDMEKSHRRMLGAVLSIILYHRQGLSAET